MADEDVVVGQSSAAGNPVSLDAEEPVCRLVAEALLKATQSFANSIDRLQTALHGDSQTLSGQYVLRRVEDLNQKHDRTLNSFLELVDSLDVLKSKVASLEVAMEKARQVLRPIIKDFKSRIDETISSGVHDGETKDHDNQVS